MGNGGLPGFLGIGAERSATTWMFQCLMEHPEVFVPEEKELHFFSTHYDEGLAWYLDWFRNSNGKRAVGEVSPEYIYAPEAPARISSVIPQVRLIVSLRNPIERAFSQYGWEVLRELHSYTFEEALERFPDYIEKGFYAEQIKRYYACFPREQLLIFFYEDMVKDPLAIIQQVYRFVGVDSAYVPGMLHFKQNRGMTNRDSLLMNALLPVSGLMRSNYLPDRALLQRSLVKLRRLRIVEHILNLFFKKYGSRQIDKNTRAGLQSTFEHHNQRLSTLIGRDVDLIWGK